MITVEYDMHDYLTINSIRNLDYTSSQPSAQYSFGKSKILQNTRSVKSKQPECSAVTKYNHNVIERKNENIILARKQFCYVWQKEADP